METLKKHRKNEGKRERKKRKTAPCISTGVKCLPVVISLGKTRYLGIGDLFPHKFDFEAKKREKERKLVHIMDFIYGNECNAEVTETCILPNDHQRATPPVAKISHFL